MGTDNGKTIGVLLLNLGGPESLSAVRPFLYNLFSDREIIRLGPSFMQKPLAWLISALRHRKTEGFYRQIGGGSPILSITRAQAASLQQALSGLPSTIKVYIGMRYWHPFIEDVVPEMHQRGIRKVIALGLYPQYSVATTGSSVARLKAAAADLDLELRVIPSWHDHPKYIDSLVARIREGLLRFEAGQGVHLLFSAHSLPQKFIDEGDPYEAQIRGTVAEVIKRLPLPWSLAFQSRSGPVKWLAPSTEETIRELSSGGVRDLLVVPVSFVSDHIETLYEIDILYKNMAERLGVRLERTESLNTSDLFIAALADIVTNNTKEAGW